MNSILDQIDDSSQPSPRGTEVTKVWSPLQQAIFEAVQTPDQDLLIQAVAGSGKTTTIIEASHHMPGYSIFLAFNKAIAEDTRSKRPDGEVKTLNSLGHSLITSRRGGRLNAKKSLDILKKIMGDSSDFKEYGYTLSRVIGLMKNCAFGINAEVDSQDVIDLIEAYAFDIPFEKLSDFGVICREGFEQSRLNTEEFDFDDQLWVPISERWAFPQYDNALIDEAQDLSPIQHLMAQALKDAGSRLVAVGDRHQAIYGFRGASHNSMDELKEMFGMTELPLSISYRCSQSVVLAAQQFCKEIQWRDNAPEGNVLWNTQDPIESSQFAKYMIVCRNNAPLFKEILRCVRNKEPCRVMSNFLDSFQSFIRGFKATYTSDLQAKLDRWFEREREACLAKGKSGKLKGLQDKYQTIKLLCGEFKLVADMVGMVKALGESTRGPIYATIHKSKGLEHEHIYVLRPDLLGGFGGLTEEQEQQEDNLHYVAITRAKETLTYGATLK